MKNLIKKYRNLLLFVVISPLLMQCESSGPFGPDISRFNSNSTGVGGSLARFTITCDNLFIVDNQSLKVLDISNPIDPTLKKTIDIGFGIETIFPYKDNLFIGANDGMYIYNIADCQDPQPVVAAKFVHVLSCDPVVATDSFAYVTLRSGGNCRLGSTSNELDIIDISDIKYPKTVATHSMINPYGLGIDGKTLFICQGDNGLYIYNVSDPLKLSMISTFPDIKSFDCIPFQKRLLVIGSDGFYQYNYEDLNNIDLMSQLLIGQ